MPKPKSKDELLSMSQSNFEKLIRLVNAYSPEAALEAFPPGTLNRNVRDVLAHLHEWHLMFLKWYDIGMKGGKPDMPAKGYTWKTLPELNRNLWEKHANTTFDTAKNLLEESYDQVQTIIKRHTEEELFEKKRYKWTGTTSLSAYLISNTSSHYDWAIKLIKKSKR